MRKLGLIERNIRGSTPIDAPICVSHFKVETTNKDIPINVEFVRGALNILQMSYLPLRYRIEQVNTEAFLIEDCTLEIPLYIKEEIISSHEQEKFTDILKKEMCTPILETGPFSRLTYYINSGDMIFTTHHIIADGRSVMQLIGRFLQILSQIQQGIKPHIEVFSELPSVEDLVPKINDDELSQSQQALSDNDKDLFPIETLPSYKLTTDFLSYTFSRENTQSMVENCRKNQISITSAVNAAAMIAFYEDLIKLHPTLEIVKILNLINIDMRSYCFLPFPAEHAIGNLISRVSTLYSMEQNKDFWALAKRMHENLKDNIQNREHLKYLRKEPQAPKVPVLCLSNTGNIDIRTNYENFKLIDFRHILCSTQGLRRTNSQYFIMVHSFDGQMTINFPFSVPIISKERAQRMLDRIVHGIEQNGLLIPPQKPLVNILSSVSASNSQQDIIVVGGGRIGKSLAAALLFNPNNRVIIIDLPPVIAALNKNGFEIVGLYQKSFITNENFIAVDRINDKLLYSLNKTKRPLVFLASRAPDALTSINVLSDIMAKYNPILVCLQNGIGIEQELIMATKKYKLTVLKGQVFATASPSEGNKVFISGGKIILEEERTSKNTLLAIFKDENPIYKFSVTSQITTESRYKAIMNCAINPLSVIFNQRLGFFCNDKLTVLMKSIIQEIVDVSRAENIYIDVEQSIEYTKQIISKSKDHFTSMHCDICNGITTEISYLNGAICRIAEKVEIAVPYNKALNEILSFLETERTKYQSAADFYNACKEILTSIQKNLFSGNPKEALEEIYRAKKESIITKYVTYNGTCHFQAKPIIGSSLNSVPEKIIGTQPPNMLIQYNVSGTPNIFISTIVSSSNVVPKKEVKSASLIMDRL